MVAREVIQVILIEICSYVSKTGPLNTHNFDGPCDHTTDSLGDGDWECLLLLA